MSFMTTVDFDVPVSEKGDNYARYKLYMAEMRESAKILYQTMDMSKKCEQNNDT